MARKWLAILHLQRIVVRERIVVCQEECALKIGVGLRQTLLPQQVSTRLPHVGDCQRLLPAKRLFECDIPLIGPGKFEVWRKPLRTVRKRRLKGRRRQKGIRIIQGYRDTGATIGCEIRISTPEKTYGVRSEIVEDPPPGPQNKISFWSQTIRNPQTWGEIAVARVPKRSPKGRERQVCWVVYVSPCC